MAPGPTDISTELHPPDQQSSYRLLTVAAVLDPNGSPVKTLVMLVVVVLGIDSNGSGVKILVTDEEVVVVLG